MPRVNSFSKNAPGETTYKIGQFVEGTADFMMDVAKVGVGIIIFILMGHYLGIGLIGSSMIALGAALILYFFSHRMTTGYWIPLSLREAWTVVETAVQ